MANRLIIDGNSVYEIDEECEKIRVQSKTASGQQWGYPSQNAKKLGKTEEKRKI